MANGTSGIGSSTSIYPGLQQQQLAAQSVPTNATQQLTPDQQLQALVQAAQGGDATAVQTLTQLQSSGALDSYIAAANAQAAGAAPGAPAAVGAPAPGALPTTDSFTPATASADASAATDPTALLDSSAGDPTVTDGTEDPAAAAKAASGGGMSDLAHYLVLSGAYKNWKVEKGLLAGAPMGNAWSREFKTAQALAPGGTLAKGGEALADGTKAKAGQYLVESKAGGLVAVKNGLLSRFKGSRGLAAKLDRGVARMSNGRASALAGEPLVNNASKLEKTMFKLNNSSVSRATGNFAQKYVGKFDERLAQHVAKGMEKQKAAAEARDAAKTAKAAAKLAKGTETADDASKAAKVASKAAAKAGGFFGSIGRALANIPGVKQVGGFLAKHSKALRRVAIIGSVINGVIDAKKAFDIITDPDTSPMKKFFSVTAVAGDVVGALPVPGAAQLVGDGVAMASAYGRDHT